MGKFVRRLADAKYSVWITNKGMVIISEGDYKIEKYIFGLNLSAIGIIYTTLCKNMSSIDYVIMYIGRSELFKE